MVDHVAFFDGRVVACTSPKHVTDCIYWRSNFDGFRNSVSHIAQHYFTQKELHAKSCLAQYEMVRDIKCVEMFEEFVFVFFNY
jgi:tRNA(His) guanylyltransferase